LTVFDPPIQQDDMSVLQLSVGEDWKRIKPAGSRVLGRRLENPYEGLVWIPSVKKDEYGGKVEVLAVGPKAKDVKVGEIVLIGPYCDLEVDDLVIFQEADIRVVFNGS
jgi:co-chaperonin GroES (HSP10)